MKGRLYRYEWWSFTMGERETCLENILVTPTAQGTESIWSGIALPYHAHTSHALSVKRHTGHYMWPKPMYEVCLLIGQVLW